MFRFNRMVMEEANGGDGGAGAGGGAAGGEATGGEPINIATPPANTGNAAPAGDGGGAAKSWLESLPDDIKNDPSLATFKEPVALAKSWVNAQKLIGANKVVIPDDKASDEEKAAFYNKLGRPDAPEKYELKPPEGYKLDDASSKTMKETAHKLGLTPAQLNGLVAFDYERIQSAQAASEAAQKNEIRENILNYQKELGGEEKYKARVDDARIGLRETTTPEFQKFLEESNLGSHPGMIEHFAKIKSMLNDGKIRDGTGVGFGADPSAIQEELNVMMHGGMDSAYWNPAHPGHAAAIEKARTLNERLVAARSGSKF